MSCREYFSHFSESDFFAFVDTVVSSDVETMTHEEKQSWTYDYCMTKYAFDSCSLLRLSLGSRYFCSSFVIFREYLPKVTMFQSIATHFVGLCPDMDTFAVSASSYACSVDDLSKGVAYPTDFPLNEIQRRELLSRHEFDHFSSETLASVVIFSSYKQDLASWSSLLRSQNTSYLLRPFHSQSTHPISTTRLGGYGIALDIKNTEYKVLDDRSSSGVRLMENDAIEAELETDIHGFYFATLKNRYPSLETELQAFKESLQQEEKSTAESILPLQMKDLGLKAVQRITHSQDPLRQLMEVSCDLPAVAASVARVPVPENLKDEALKMNDIYGAESGSVYVNDQKILLDSTSFNVFELQQTLREVLDFKRACEAMNLTENDISSLTSILSNYEDQERERVIRLSSDILSNPYITYLNDIQHDSRYARFSSSVNRFLMPLFQLPIVRANYISRIIVMDPQHVQLNVLQSIYEFIQQGYPVQWGIILYSPSALQQLKEESSDLKMDEEISAAQLMELAVALTESNHKLLLIVFLNNFLAGSDYSLRAALRLFDELAEKDGSEVLQSESYRNKVRAMCEWVERVGLDPEKEILNGQVSSLRSVESFFQAISSEIDRIVEGVKSEAIKSVKDIQSYLYSQSQVFDVYIPELSLPFTSQTYRDISMTLEEGEKGVVVLSLPSLNHIIAAISYLSLFEGYSLYLTTPLTPLLSLIYAIKQINALDSFTEVLICLKDEELSVNQIQRCLELYLEDDELQTLGESWKTDESFSEMNNEFQKQFHSSRVEILLNGRYLALSTVTPSIVKELIHTDQVLFTPIHTLLPTYVLKFCFNLVIY